MDLDDFTAQGIHLGLEPPIDGEDDTDYDGPRVSVWATMWEADDTRRTANVSMAPDATDDQIATAMVQTMVAVAAMRGPGVLGAVKARVRDL